MNIGAIGLNEPVRNDQPYQVRIPSFSHNNGVVLYEVRLLDMLNCQQHCRTFRFKELKTFYQDIKQHQGRSSRIRIARLEFPKTHFLIRTNQNPELIEERRSILERYFSLMINDAKVRGCKGVREFVASCKAKGRERSQSIRIPRTIDTINNESDSQMAMKNRAKSLTMGRNREIALWQHQGNLLSWYLRSNISI